MGNRIKLSLENTRIFTKINVAKENLWIVKRICPCNVKIARKKRATHIHIQGITKIYKKSSILKLIMQNAQCYLFTLISTKNRRDRKTKRNAKHKSTMKSV